MKKFSILFLTILMFATAAQAENIVVIDQNGNVIRQMFTSPTTYTQQVVTTSPAPIPAVTVVRESPVIEQSYYYDRNATNAALAAGVTTAVVGGLLFHDFRGHHHHHHGGWHRGHSRHHW